MQKRAFAAKQRHLTPFRVMDFLDAAVRLEAAGRDLVRMEAGQPTFPLPATVAEAAHAALSAANLYTAALGQAPLREAIAHLYDRRYGISLDPARVIVTTGSSAALMMLCDLLLDPGDSMLLPDPGYPCNANFVRRCNAEVIRVAVSAEHDYQLRATDIERHWQANTVGAIVASPSNPTGDVLSAAALRDLADAVRARGGHLIVDEIYHGLNYTEEGDVSVLNVCDDAFVINSFSKYFGLPGWRLGWMVVPESAIAPLETMAQNFFISPPNIAQQVALAALAPAAIEAYEARRELFRARRDFLVPALRNLGFGIHRNPSGAFYIYTDVSRLTDDSDAFCWRVLEEAGVAITPGTDFGANGARTHVRLSYTEDMPRLEMAVERLAAFLGNRREI